MSKKSLPTTITDNSDESLEIEFKRQCKRKAEKIKGGSSIGKKNDGMKKICEQFEKENGFGETKTKEDDKRGNQSSKMKRIMEKFEQENIFDEDKDEKEIKVKEEYIEQNRRITGGIFKNWKKIDENAERLENEDINMGGLNNMMDNSSIEQKVVDRLYSEGRIAEFDGDKWKDVERKSTSKAMDKKISGLIGQLEQMNQMNLSYKALYEDGKFSDQEKVRMRQMGYFQITMKIQGSADDKFNEGSFRLYLDGNTVWQQANNQRKMVTINKIKFLELFVSKVSELVDLIYKHCEENDIDSDIIGKIQLMCITKNIRWSQQWQCQ